MRNPLPLAVAITLSLGAASAAAAPPYQPIACNGFESLCDRPYDEVSYATTHNAFNYLVGRDPQFHFPNQGHDIPTQLADGVRALMIDVHEYNGFDASHQGEVWVCHSFCWLGGEPLVDVLTDIRLFMDSHPDEVISIIFESYVSREATEEAFIDSGLIGYVHAQPLGQPWPTLRQMIMGGGRLVVFTDHEGGSPAWYHDVWDYAVETHFSVKEPEDFDCTYNRGDSRNDLFIFNHFLTKPLARPSLAYQVNFDPFLLDRALECWAYTSKRPHFITVDFYDIGDVLEAVDVLNGVD